MKLIFLTSVFVGLIAVWMPTKGQDADLLVKGVIYGHQGLPLGEVQLKLSAENEKTTSIATKSNGIYQFELQFDHQYELLIEKNGFEPVKLVFNTKGLSKEEQNFQYELSRLRITMVPGASTTSPKIIQDYQFDHERGNFRNVI